MQTNSGKIINDTKIFIDKELKSSILFEVPTEDLSDNLNWLAKWVPQILLRKENNAIWNADSNETAIRSHD